MKRSARNTIIIAVAALFITMILLVLFDLQDPISMLSSFFLGPFNSSYSIGSIIAKAALLMTAGTGVAVAFRGGLFNLGGEGQVYGGAVAAVVLSLYMPRLPGILGILIILTAAMILGSAIAAVSGILKHYFSIHELISSFLLSGGLVYIFDFLITAPLRDPNSFLIATPLIPQKFWLSEITASSALTSSIFLALGITAAGQFWMFHSIAGYKIRLFGANPSCAEYGGISAKKQTILAMSISGGLYGLTGALAVLGIHHQGIQGFTSGLGWDGITVALAAGISPIYTVLSAFLIAFIDSGIEASMAGSSITYDLGLIIKGTILVLVTLKLSAGKRGLT
ncbi:MAG: ABC transporter permease [Spirochaetales bacterium]|nr:ABC transporter permease [Spirochaetales bacterium]